MIKQFTLIGAIALSVIACNKYEDGPAFSLKTKTSRIIGEWKLVAYNGGDSLIEKVGPFTQFWWQCGETYSAFTRIITKTDVIWEIEGDRDLKEKFFGVVREFKHGQSFIPPDCEPFYLTTDSSIMLETNSWSFSNNKIDFRIDIGNSVKEFEIKRLTNEEMVLEDDFDNVYEFEKLTD